MYLPDKIIIIMVAIINVERMSTLGGVTLHHLIIWLETRPSDLIHPELLMVGLVGAGNRGVGSEGVVDPRVGNQVGLELIEVHIESSVKPEAGRDGGDDLSYETVEVGVGRSFHGQVIMAEVVDCLQFMLINYLIIK